MNSSQPIIWLKHSKHIILIVLYALFFFCYIIIPPIRNPYSINLFLIVSSLHAFMGFLLWYHFRDTIKLWQTLWIYFFSRAILFFMYPWLSDDVFAYLFYGNATAHGFNLYAYPANSEILKHLHDSIYQLMAFKEFGIVYPPLNTLIVTVSSLLAQIIGFGSTTALYSWKICCLISEILTGFLLLRIKLFSHLNPKSVILFYCLVPFTGIEMIGQAHNDVLLLPILILFLYCGMIHFQKRSIYSSLDLGIVAGLLFGIKLVPVILILPFIILEGFNKNSFFIIIGLLATMILPSILFFHGSLVGNHQALYGFLGVLSYYNSTLFNGVPLYLIRWTLSLFSVHEWWLIAPKVLTMIRSIVVIILSMFYRVFKSNQIAKTLYILMVGATFLSPKVHTWYMIPLVVLGILADYTSMMMITWIMILSYGMYSVYPPHENFLLETIIWIPAIGIFFWELKNKRKVLEIIVS